MFMSKVVSAMAVSVDGFITGRNPGPGNGLGDGGALFDWYFNGEVRSEVFDGFKLSETSARLFDGVAARVGASIAGRTTYEDSDRFGDSGAPHPSAPLFVVSHRPAPQMAGRQKLISTGLSEAVSEAREAADGKDIALMGGVLVTEALKAGLVDELILHQVPVLLGGGRRYFHSVPEHVNLSLIQAIAAPGVTHLHYEVIR
jgi:dihydrofolate reductase